MQRKNGAILKKVFCMKATSSFLLFAVSSVACLGALFYCFGMNRKTQPKSISIADIKQSMLHGLQ